MANFVFGGRDVNNGETIPAPFRQVVRVGLWGPLNTYVSPPTELTVEASPADAAKVTPGKMQGNVRGYEIRGLWTGRVTIAAKAGTQTWAHFDLDVQSPQYVREGPYTDVNTRLPDTGNGYTTYRFVADNAHWGLPETVDALKTIANNWAAAHPGGHLAIGDISLQSGGQIPGHASHQKGVDVDMWPMDGAGNAVHVSFNDASYSRANTQQLVNTIRNNGVLKVAMIFFNDPNVTGVQKWPAHDEHLHIRFTEPYEIKMSPSFAKK